MMGQLDDTDRKMAVVATQYFIRAHTLIHQPVPAAAYRLLGRLTSASGPEPAAPQPQWVTTADAARITGYSARHIRRIAPLIGGRRIGRAWAIPTDALADEDSHDDT